ncbi:MAG: hypothetical protein GX196_00645 [Clostridiaceae bacterium]|nr:hypothetical protein [Clostridiaceae bacterium]
MLEFIMANWISILIVAVIVAIIIILLRLGYTPIIKEMLFYLVVKAEQELGGGVGELKYSTVVYWVYERLPAIAKIIITPKFLDKLIEEAVQRMKKYLSENQNAAELINNNK